MSNPNLAAAMAATHVAERFFERLKQMDRDGLKRLIDEASEQLESRLAEPGEAEPIKIEAAKSELRLLRMLYAHLT